MLSGLQVVVDLECDGYSLIEDGKIHTGAAIRANGELVASPGGKQKVGDCNFQSRVGFQGLRPFGLLVLSIIVFGKNLDHSKLMRCRSS